MAAGSPEIRALALVRTLSPFLLKTRQSDIETSHSQHAARPSLPSPRHNWSPLIYSCVCPSQSTLISQPHTKKKSPRADLISLDSPFIQEPKPAEKANAPDEHEEQQQDHHDFANAWDTLSAFSARGWCDGTIDTAVRRLQGLGLRRGLAVLPADQPPFEGTTRRFFLSPPQVPDLPAGELKILILGDADGGQGRAALRLHDSSDDDEDGYLWRMRSESEALLMAVKQVLAT
jgi:hypothetical protein